MSLSECLVVSRSHRTCNGTREKQVLHSSWARDSHSIHDLDLGLDWDLDEILVTIWVSLPAARLFCRANTGRAKAWLSFILNPMLVPENSSNFDLLSRSIGTVLCMYTAILTAYSHKQRCTATGHLAFACKSINLAASVMSQITLLAMLFSKYALMPQ